MIKMIDSSPRIYFWKSNLLSNRVQYLFVFLILVITQSCLKIITDELLIVILLFSSFIFLVKRKNFDILVICIVGAWIVINIISYAFNKTSFNTWTFIGFIVKILYPYFILKLVGKTFFEKLERIVFVLTCISIPLFSIQILFPGFITTFTHIFMPITTNDLQSGIGWYGIVFGINGTAPFRNSGFMWEPGAFAFMLLLCLLYRIMKFGLRFDFRNVIYIIALVTTFSTMAYLGIAVLLIAYTMSSKKIGIVFLVIPLIIIYMGFVTDLDFMLPKITNYFQTLNLAYTPTGQTFLKVNRLAYILFTFQQSLLWPFGYGVVPSKYMYNEYNGNMLEGVGTIASLLLFWGWIGLAFFITAVYKYLKNLQIERNEALLIFGVLVLLIAFFSNPLEKSPILYSIVFYPFIYKKN